MQRSSPPQRAVLPLGALLLLLLAVQVLHSLPELRTRHTISAVSAVALSGIAVLHTSSRKVLENSVTRSLYLAWLSAPAEAFMAQVTSCAGWR